MGVEQALVQQIVATVNEAYLADIRNHTTKSINETMADILTHLQENYGQLMLHELLERKDIVKETAYHPRESIATVFSASKELLEFSNIARNSYMQHQAVNISYTLIQRASTFGLEICECNRTLIVQKIWVGLKQVFGMAYHKLRETTDLTVQDAGMNHIKMVRDVVAGLQ